MTFHKGTFVIQMNELYGTVECACGWIDDTNTYGFYKSFRNMWRATDLLSGTLITVQPTRKACAEWIRDNADRIAEAKSKETYRKKVEDFERLIRERLFELSLMGEDV